MDRLGELVHLERKTECSVSAGYGFYGFAIIANIALRGSRRFLHLFQPDGYVKPVSKRRKDFVDIAPVGIAVKGNHFVKILPAYPGLLGKLRHRNAACADYITQSQKENAGVFIIKGGLQILNRAGFVLQSAGEIILIRPECPFRSLRGSLLCSRRNTHTLSICPFFGLPSFHRKGEQQSCFQSVRNKSCNRG